MSRTCVLVFIATLLAFAPVAGATLDPAVSSGGPVRMARLAPGLASAALPGFVTGASVNLGGDIRRAISSTRSVGGRGAWADEPGVVETALPANIPATPWRFVRLVRKLDSRVVTDDAAIVRGDTGEAVQRIGPLAVEQRSGGDTMLVVVTPATDLASRDLLSQPVVVPANGVLTVAFGIEEAAWTPAAPPVTFAIAAAGDPETVVFERTLDPGRRREDRGWVEARVPLAAIAGRTVRFRFTARAVPQDDLPGTTPVSLPLWSEPVLVAKPADPPLGVVLISLDTLRARSTSSGGAQRPTTPRLDAAMGGEGVVFENAITTSPHTLPAHVSMFTGCYVRSHGVRSPLTRIAPEHATLTEALARAGYATAAFTENGFVLPDVGLGRGFDHYRENKSADLHRPDGFAAAIFDAGLTWLTKHREAPFFLFLHTYQVHHPYVPPAPYDTAFEPAGLLGTPDEVALLRYEQEVRYIDDEVGLFLDGLAALGLRERTLVVVTSDHGEEFLEHGQRYHLFQLYDEAVRVPLMFRLPGVLPGGRRVSSAVSLTDVAPTILDLLGLPPLPGADGTSLVPLLLDDAGPFPRDGVFSETISSLVAPQVDLVGLRRERLSCIRNLTTDATRCFDLAIDPMEEVPLPANPYDARLMEAGELLSTFVRGGASAAGGSPVKGDVDAERLEKLKALGYVE